VDSTHEQRHPHRVVVKVGTRLVVDADGLPRRDFLNRMADEIRDLMDRGIEVLLITSGAVRIGRRTIFGDPARALRVSERPSAAAVGQPILMGYWSEAMGRVGITSAQVLLTQDDVVSRGRCMRLRETMEDLLSWRVLPVLNENDSVSTESVTFGENDLMAAMVAVAVTPAELLVILSDQEGLFTADPREHADARLISEVQPNEDVSRFATGAGGPESLGGMEKKLEAAKRATDCGIRVVIAGGDLPGVLTRIVAGEPVGTCMLAGPRLPSRKAWLAVHLMPQGTLIVDDGARRALLHADGASLLPSGIMTAEGHFHAGDLVVVLDRDGQEIARGLTNYSAEETRAIMGAHSSRIPELIGREGAAEVIHRDDMVVNAPHGT